MCERAKLETVVHASKQSARREEEHLERYEKVRLANFWAVAENGARAESHRSCRLFLKARGGAWRGRLVCKLVSKGIERLEDKVGSFLTIAIHGNVPWESVC